jgi:hypothetical protein
MVQGGREATLKKKLDPLPLLSSSTVCDTSPEPRHLYVLLVGIGNVITDEKFDLIFKFTGRNEPWNCGSELKYEEIVQLNKD